jgi:hypothetical protein
MYQKKELVKRVESLSLEEALTVLRNFPGILRLNDIVENTNYEDIPSVPYLYLAQATEGNKEEVEEWRQNFQNKTGLRLVNPYFDIDAEILAQERKNGGFNSGAVDDKILIPEEIKFIYHSDGIARWNARNYTDGAPKEEMIAIMMGKPDFLLALNGVITNPWTKHWPDKISTNVREFENSIEEYMNAKIY